MFWLIVIVIVSLFLSGIRLGIIERKKWQFTVLEFWNGFINFFIPGLIGYFFILYRLPHIKTDGVLALNDFILILVFLMGAFGHLHILSKNITEGVEAILKRVLEK